MKRIDPRKIGLPQGFCPICDHILRIHFKDGCSACNCDVRFLPMTLGEYFEITNSKQRLWNALREPLSD